MAMVAVMGALAGARAWLAIRIENGPDARTRPGRSPACGRRCTLGDDRRIAGRRHPVQPLRCRGRHDARYPVADRAECPDGHREHGA
jgi:hypothetical protein